MKLVDDINTLWKRWSTRIAASQLGLVGFWAALPAELKAAVPGWALAITVAVFAVAFVSAQAVAQASLRAKDGAQ
jgi:hypothetical protein